MAPRRVPLGGLALKLALILAVAPGAVLGFSVVTAALDGAGRKTQPSWGLRYRATTLPRLVGWAPRGCPLRRRASPEHGSCQQLSCGSAAGEGREARVHKVESWECFDSEQRQNFTRAVWTCASPNQIFFTYDREECHYIHEGRARVAVVPQPGASSLDAAGGDFVEVKTGDCVITPAGARICWDVMEPITKQTSCREPFRMVSQGWILAPPLSSGFTAVTTLGSGEEDGEPNTRTLRRASLLGEALQHSTHQSASALLDTLQEGLSQQTSLRNRLS
eukprot:Tamp_16759.p1 GENE.Tamp_16759~~Tamp_16759.p1  ORF type:complete len:307 (-),score=44.09 Tamp_16759:517-1347(-)